MNCPKCGFAMTPLDRECPRCVWMKTQPRRPDVAPPITQTQAVPSHQPTMVYQAVPPLPTVPHGMHAAHTTLSCPSCGGVEVQKVSLLVQGGTVVTRSSGVSLGAAHVFGGPNIGMVGVSSNTAVGQSALVQMLTPPAEPKVPTNTSGCGVFALGFFGGLFALSGLLGMIAPKSGGDALAPLILGIGLCVGAFYMWRSGVSEHEKRMQFYNTAYPAWRHAMEQWNLLFCCQRCGCVFEPHSRRMAAPQEMQRLLYP